MYLYRKVKILPDLLEGMACGDFDVQKLIVEVVDFILDSAYSIQNDFELWHHDEFIVIINGGGPCAPKFRLWTKTKTPTAACGAAQRYVF